MSASRTIASTTALSAVELAANGGADWTIREIAQQPDMWRRALANLDEHRAELDAWLELILAKPGARIILTGAGTSAYAGEMIAPALTQRLARPVEAIATTDIVASPLQHLLPDVPTVLVSFARSGSSPESLAAVELTDQLVSDAHHLVLCCNPDSPLVRFTNETARDARCLLMPVETLDRSFAMTSSVTSMVLTALSLFADDPAQNAVLEASIRRLLVTSLSDIGDLVGGGLDRAIFLGSGGLAGAAKEAALKCLELSAGRTITLAESSLGLRHGPKFAVRDTSLVVVLTGSDPHTRNYDLDIAAELERDGVARDVVRLDLIDHFAGAPLDDPWLCLAYLVWCQLLAYRNAVVLGVSPDNPSPNGDVNRVVQGVTIHPFAPTR